MKAATERMAEERGMEVADKFAREVKRLLASGLVDPKSHNRGMLFGVALENMADNFLRGDRNTREYRNMKRA